MSVHIFVLLRYKGNYAKCAFTWKHYIIVVIGLGWLAEWSALTAYNVSTSFSRPIFPKNRICLLRERYYEGLKYTAMSFHSKEIKKVWCSQDTINNKINEI